MDSFTSKDAISEKKGKISEGYDMIVMGGGGFYKLWL